MSASAAPLAVSIIVPTRNRAAALQRCLSALVAQRDVGPLEIIVVDDGSIDADGVSAVVASQPLARLVRVGGGGPAAARNTGVAAASGTYVCFTDDDASLAPNGWELVSRSRQVRMSSAGRQSTVSRDLFVET